MKNKKNNRIFPLLVEILFGAIILAVVLGYLLMVI